MGRRVNAVRDSRPVPLPHDGPLAAAAAATSAGGDDPLPQPGSPGDDGISEDKRGLRRAALHLLRVGLSAEAEAEDTDVDVRSQPERLLWALARAPSLEAQLRALQSAKARLAPPAAGTTGELPGHSSRALAPLGLVLLEFALSIDTPPPLRRALQSVLDALRPHLGDTGDGGSSSSSSTDAVWTRIVESVLDTILVADAGSGAAFRWRDPVAALQHAAAYPPAATHVHGAAARALLHRAARALPPLDAAPSSRATAARLEEAARIAAAFRGLPAAPDSDEDDDGALAGLRDFFLRALSSPAISIDQLRVMVVAYGRSVRWDAAALRELLVDTLPRLPELPRATLLQGAAASVPDGLLMECVEVAEPRVTFLQQLHAAFQQLSLTTPSPDVRLEALKGIRTLLSRCDDGLLSPHDNQLAELLTTETLRVVLRAWENPNRRLANALPALFQSLLRLLRRRPEPDQLAALMERVLRQPRHQRGRYLALDLLLPEVGARALLEHAAGCHLPDELLHGVAEPGHNTAVVADLWASLLHLLLRDQLLEASVEIDRPSAKRQDRCQPGGEAMAAESASQRVLAASIFDKWASQWIPGLALVLVSMEISRCQQVVSFCLPRILKIADERKEIASKVYRELLVQIMTLETKEFIRLPIKEKESLQDRILWAAFQCVMAAQNVGLIRSFDSVDFGRDLKQTIAICIPPGKLSIGLVSSSTMVRSAAFRAIFPVVACHELEQDTPMSQVLKEKNYWEISLSYASKDMDNHCLSSILCALAEFMDRLSMKEAEQVTPNADILSVLPHFVIDFLIKDIMFRKNGYPGSPRSKANFALFLLECILVFSARDSTFALRSKLLPKTAPVFTRRRLAIEETTTAMIRRQLLCQELFSVMESLLSSTWDDIRVKVSQYLQALINTCDEYQLTLPGSIPIPTHGRGSEFESRAVYMASSPRQHECDRGARLLLLLCSISPVDEKQAFTRRLVIAIKDRLELMVMTVKSMDSVTEQLPLVHGIIRGLRLIVEESGLSFVLKRKETIHEIAVLLLSALRLSLSIVADADEGSEFDEARRYKKMANINPGALGANGIVGSVRHESIIEQTRQMASQRLVVGSWLLTKDTCETLAVVLSIKDVPADAQTIDDAGRLLLRTQVYVKHTGAAYAAHKSLQQLAALCFDSDEEFIESLPRKWLSFLLESITESDKVRNSTLRRSTGYALGVLALMRSEISSRRNLRQLCQSALSHLVKFSLPSQRELYDVLGLESLKDFPLFTTSDDNETKRLTRVHALNILRLILLDAPLADVSVPVAGDALVSSIVGYLDPEWTVRNSATMVFAAAMLRVVDPDLNAANPNITSCSAATIGELFSTYSSLSDFIRVILCNATSRRVEIKRSDNKLPAELPLMIFLSRVQPVRTSDSNAARQTEPLIRPLMEALKHRSTSIRIAAAKALSNLSVDNNTSPASRTSLLRICRDKLFASVSTINEQHGVLCLIAELAESGGYLEQSSVTDDIFSQIFTNVFRFVNDKPTSPPLWLSSALRIIETCPFKDQHMIEQVLAKMVLWLENDKSATGAAEIGSMVGSSACKHLLLQIWDVNGYGPEIESKLARLLTSSSFDIRAMAIKAFKKSIYDGIDGVLPHDCQKLLKSMRSMLLEALLWDLDTLQHPPNIRRLSRCLLECLSAMLRCNDHLDVDEQEKIWEAASRMVGSCALNGSDPLRFTAVDGNAAELMSFAVRGADPSAEKYRCFVELVVLLSDPYLPWRLRHSSAISISNSGLLMGPLIEHSELLRRPIVCTVMRLTQDADSDVRHALLSSLRQLTSMQGASSPVPEIILKDVVCSEIGDSKGLIQSSDVILWTLEFTVDLLGTMEAFLKEFCLVNAASFDLLNTGISRRIFEEETPNEYVEEALLIQLLVQELLARRGTKPLVKDPISAQTLLSRCESILLLLCQMQTGDYDVTSERRVMPLLHSLLLVSAMALHFSSDKREEFRALAQTTQQRRLHPLVRSVLDAVMAGDFDSQSYCQKIMGCCFLLFHSKDSP